MQQFLDFRLGRQAARLVTRPLRLGTEVLLDGIEVTAKVVSGTSIELKTPGGKDGRMVDVMVRNPDGKQDVEVRAFVYDERYD